VLYTETRMRALSAIRHDVITGGQTLISVVASLRDGRPEPARVVACRHIRGGRSGWGFWQIRDAFTGASASRR